VGSFTRAAVELGVSQPAVAEHVRNLEATLGIQLFTRAGRGVRPTPAGEAFVERAAAVLATLDEAVSSVGSIAVLETGTLAIGLFATPEAYSIDRLAADFVRRHPGIAMRLVGRDSRTVPDRVRRGELDACLVTLPIDDAGLDVRPIARDPVVYVSANPANTAAPVTIDDAVRRPLVIYEEGAGDRHHLLRQMRQRAQELGLRLTPTMQAETVAMALRLVADGVGDTFVPSAHTRAPGFPTGLSSVGFRPAVHETFAIVMRTGARPTPATRAFVNLIVAHMRSSSLGLERL